MIHSSVGYCACGHEIWIEYIRSGSAWATRFSDDEHSELNRCPSCGRSLTEDDLESR